jgi:hypothetical protein
LAALVEENLDMLADLAEGLTSEADVISSLLKRYDARLLFQIMQDPEQDESAKSYANSTDLQAAGALQCILGIAQLVVEAFSTLNVPLIGHALKNRSAKEGLCKYLFSKFADKKNRARFDAIIDRIKGDNLSIYKVQAILSIVQSTLRIAPIWTIALHVTGRSIWCSAVVSIAEAATFLSSGGSYLVLRLISQMASAVGVYDAIKIMQQHC